MDANAFRLLYYPIKYQSYDEPIYIIPFGDIHRHTALCHVEKWREFLEWAKNKERAYFIGMGDYDDLVSASERKALIAAGLHETTRDTLEEVYVAFIDKFYDEISFMKDRCIGLLEGNHYGELQDGTTTTQRLCQKLNCAYLGCSAFVRLSLKKENHGNRNAIDIWLHHGRGAAQKVGGSLNRVETMSEASECDICLMGHDHRKSVGYLSRLYIKDAKDGNLTLGQRKVLIARTGSFLRGYVDNVKSYIAEKAYNPSDLGTIKIELTPRRKCSGGEDRVYIDIHASI